jgi:hypothetical protein
MKIKVLTILLIAALLSGCGIYDDYSDCPVDSNLILEFYLDDRYEQGVILADVVKTLDIFLFDEAGAFISHSKVSSAKFEGGNRYSMSVDPGSYHVVCWGNADERSRISEMHAHATLSGSYVEGTHPFASSPLYYGPVRGDEDVMLWTRATESVANTELIVMNAGEHVVKEVLLSRAYRNINVYVEGANHLTGYDGRQPLVELDKMHFKYDFRRNTYNDRRSYTNRAEHTDKSTGAVPLSLAAFSTPISMLDEEMFVRLRWDDGAESLYDLGLREWVEANPPDNAYELNILFKIGVDASVTITVPRWDDKPVTPGF